MKIEILNSSPESLKDFFEYIEKHLPPNLVLTPIVVEFGLAEFIEYESDDLLKIDVNVYDYYDENNNNAEFDIEDANLLFNEMIFDSNTLQVDDKIFKLKEYKNEKPKKHKKRKTPE